MKPVKSKEITGKQGVTAMKSFIVATMLVVLAAMPDSVLAEAPDLARLSYVKGSVQIYTDDTGEWVPASINTPLLEGDRLWAPAGARAEVHMQGGLFMRLDARSAYDILALRDDSYQ